MSFKYFIVDSFTRSPFGGNPAGVVLLTEERDEAWMRQVAGEVNHSETAFIDMRRSSEGGPLPLRWFTPSAEVDLCGHATLAAAHVFGGSVRFSTNSGILTCGMTEDGRIEMDFPADLPAPVQVDVSTALPSAEVLGTHEGRFDLLVEVASVDQVLNLSFDLAEMGKLPYRGIVVTAVGDGQTSDYVTRCFYPRLGLTEDPVTGSAHCTLASYWAVKLGKQQLVGYQLSARRGFVESVMTDARVTLSGYAVTVMSGELRA